MAPRVVLVGPMGGLSLRLGLPELTGAYAASAGMFVLAILVVFAFLRPDPRDVGRQLALDAGETEVDARAARPLSVIFRQPAVVAAVSAMVRLGGTMLG